MIKEFLMDEDGLTSMEYILVASVIVLVVFAAFKLLGNDLKTLIDKIRAAINN